MTIHVRVAGIWEPVVNVYSRVAGEWRSANTFSARAAGVWEQVFGGSVVVTGPVTILSAQGQAGVRFQTDGGLDRLDGFTASPYASGEWWTNEPQGTIGANWRVRCESINSGSFSSQQAAAVGDWVRINSSRSWKVKDAPMGGGPGIVSAEFEIAPYPSGAAVATFTVTLESAG